MVKVKHTQQVEPSPRFWFRRDDHLENFRKTAINIGHVHQSNQDEFGNNCIFASFGCVVWYSIYSVCLMACVPIICCNVAQHSVITSRTHNYIKYTIKT